jgi:hypothetical protein
MLNRTGLCIICSNNGVQSGQDIKFTVNGIQDKPDPDICESDMLLYLREPIIQSIAVWTSRHDGTWFIIEGI